VTIVVGRAFVVLAVLALTEQPPALTPLKAGLVIDRSATIRPGIYRLSASADLARPAITIHGEIISVDFNGAVLADGAELADSDGDAGVGIEGTTTRPHGDYTLQVISDDGVRVWMDGAMILDEWAPHESKVNRVSIRGGGERRSRVEYYDVTGFAELRFDIQRK
jgi:PA14 domain